VEQVSALVSALVDALVGVLAVCPRGVDTSGPKPQKWTQLHFRWQQRQKARFSTASMAQSLIPEELDVAVAHVAVIEAEECPLCVIRGGEAHRALANLRA